MSAEPAPIAVTGAFGQLGTATIERLLDGGMVPGRIVAVVPDRVKATAPVARGIQVRRADFKDPISLERALRGVERLAMPSANALGDDRLLHDNVVKAARSAKVGHIFYTSGIKPAAVARFAPSPGHFQTEAQIRDSGIPWTFFRNNLYLDLVLPLFDDALSSGKLVSNGGDGRIGFVLLQDIACGLAAALTSDGHAHRAYAITAPTPYSLGDVARALGKAAGKAVSYEAVSSQQLRDAMTAQGFLPPSVEMYVALGDAIRAGEFDAASEDLAGLTGRAPMTLEEFLTPALVAKQLPNLP